MSPWGGITLLAGFALLVNAATLSVGGVLFYGAVIYGVTQLCLNAEKHKPRKK